MVYNRENFRKHIETIAIDGFKLKSAVQAYLFVRTQPNRKETITLSYKDYAPHGFYISGVTASIYFPEVEDWLEDYGLAEEHKYTFMKVFQDLEGIDYQKFNTEINTDESFEVVRKVIDDILEKGVMPFLTRFTTIEEIAWFLTDKKTEQILPYVQGPILLPKTVLIMKMAKHPDFRKRLFEFQNVLSEYQSKNDQYKILKEKYDNLFSEDLKEFP